MNNQSHQVSDASIKRYWKIREPKTIEGIEANERLRPIEIFNKWADQENFCKYTRWEALRKIASMDHKILSHVLYELRDKTEKLNQVSSAFELINSLTKES